MTALPDPGSATPQLQALEALMGLFNGIKHALRDALPAEDTATLAPMHLRLLSLCQRHPGSTQQALAQRTGRDKGQIARLAKDLLDAGLLVREPDPQDRRSHRLNLTAAGLAACARFHQAEMAVARRIFGPVPDAELAALLEQLRTLRGRLGPAQGDA